MAETLHVTMVRTPFRYWQAGDGQAGHPLINVFSSSINSQGKDRFQIKNIQDDELCKVYLYSKFKLILDLKKNWLKTNKKLQPLPLNKASSIP